ncbi:MAG: PcfB family protein [Bacillota bacterium]
MNNGEAADQIVNMSLRGVEVTAKITGVLAKNLAVYIAALMKDQKRTKGKIRLETMLKSDKELDVFAVKKEDLPRFMQEAKRYGVLYAALRDKKSLDGMCDIMVRTSDASKINRIVERFNLSTVDVAKVKSEIQQERAARSNEAFQRSNPTQARAEKSRPSEPISESKKGLGGDNRTERPSTKEALREIINRRQKKGGRKQPARTAPQQNRNNRESKTKGR